MSDICSSDEVESIRVAELEEKLGERDRELAFQHRSLTALLSISEVSDGQLTLAVVFEHALRTLQEITGFSTVVLRLYNPHDHCYEVRAQSGLSHEMMASMKCAPIDADNLPSEATRRRWPVWEGDLVNNRYSWDGPLPAKYGFRSVICVPLLTENQLVGTMELASLTPYQWSESELTWLALVGRVIASIIEHVQLMDRMRNLAALEERTRLLQEIHDGLAQSIGAMRLWAENASDSLKYKDYDAAGKAVMKIEASAYAAYIDLREEMTGLRIGIAPGGGALKVIREYLAHFQHLWGIESRLEVNAGDQYSDNLPISPAAEIQLMRIVQEALANVRRHSQGSQVVVVLEQRQDELRVSIRDNGKGFSADNVTGDGIGMKIMRERAASVAGELNIQTEYGQGTCVTVTFPVSKQPE